MTAPLVSVHDQRVTTERSEDRGTGAHSAAPIEAAPIEAPDTPLEGNSSAPQGTFLEPAPNPAIRKGSWDDRWPVDGASPASTPPTDPQARAAKPAWRKCLNIIIVVAAVAVVFFVLRGKLPSLASIGAALQKARWEWIVVAAICTAASISLFAEQQRQLLKAFETRITRRRTTAITYASTALTNSLPAGAAVSAGFSFNQYRAAGASRATAATVMVLSGLISIATLVLLYLVVLSATAATSFITLVTENRALIIVIAVIFVVLVAVILRRAIRGPASLDGIRSTPRLDQFEIKWPKIAGIIRDGRETLRQAKHVKFKEWMWAILATSGKWALEGVCLLMCCLAFDIQIDLLQLAGLYLSVQLVRQIPLTPGGIGPVETALLVGLLTYGAGYGTATAAVLIYRVLSAWIIIPIGFALLAEMKRRDARREAASTAELV
ncbi:lysylphosphatidylglycerol synthase transmembrane domain-containing protein [Nakamurella antarctica]|uniref:lysylphosphatidylglycerol synthase transmembrane domain-containing protein n=1 Tax=Nakamurella antarctica TaxID=1902245 RepID=UPI0013DDF25A|nr:YbhN family protein [Nakamurella antarctica]